MTAREGICRLLPQPAEKNEANERRGLTFRRGSERHPRRLAGLRIRRTRSRPDCAPPRRPWDVRSWRRPPEPRSGRRRVRVRRRRPCRCDGARRWGASSVVSASRCTGTGVGNAKRYQFQNIWEVQNTAGGGSALNLLLKTLPMMFPT